MSEELGICGLCGRVMIPGPSVNQHHLVPKTYGGRVAVDIHRVCHSKIHSLFTERQLLRDYDTFEKLLTHEEIIKFVRWVRKKPPLADLEEASRCTPCICPGRVTTRAGTWLTPGLRAPRSAGCHGRRWRGSREVSPVG